ncbi:carboxypeptidase regulatory-like domain-containing protein [Variovorax sp. GT1P44]|uniref:carboxypeptidase regulatory-like domain-containing protein n=1 Tax=Variovorax sp. GT1P44 TaxID=3443742 RepID=UPI003F45701C
MPLLSSTVRAAAMSLSCLATPLLAQNLPAIPPLQTQGAASFTCGGIGEASSKAMLAARKDYPLSLLFATAGGEYMASVTVTVKDGKGASVLTVPSTGPVCLIKLPDGSYTVDAQASGKTKSQAVTVGGGPKAIDFSF